MYCPKCGTVLAADAEYCHKCGWRLTAEARSELPEMARPSMRIAEPDSGQSAFAKQSPIIEAAAKAETMGQGSTLRTRLFLGGVVVVVLAFMADFFYRRDYYADPGNALPTVLGGGLILLALWFVVSGILALSEPPTRRGHLVYWGGSFVAAFLSAAISLLLLRPAEQQMIAAGNLATVSGAILSVWGLLHWRWFMASHWLLKLVLGPFLLVPFAVPARMIAFFVASGIIYLVGVIR
jgi:hypothetical protein